MLLRHGAIPLPGPNAFCEPQMKVVLIYRSKSRGDFSIENVFETVAPELRRSVEVVEYYLTSKWGNLNDVIALRRLHADIYHITGDVHYIALALPSKRTVVTVADMYHFLYGLSGIHRWLYRTLWFDLPLRHAALVTAISEETRRHLLLYCPCRSSKVEVVPCPVGPGYRLRPNCYSSDLPRVLFIGTAEHKNLVRAAKALQGMHCQLVIVGQLSEPVRELLSELGIAYENHVGLDADQVQRQYREAAAVLFPSLREGFGLPILEAQAVGCPVITSDLSPMRDVAGLGACLVDPLDAASIAAGVSRVLSDAGYRSALVEAGRANVERYSAAAVADQYLALYYKVRSRACRQEPEGAVM